ncbi:PP2C family protein-serine/threonine phosphatase [Streptomyces sp. TLI_146]|uniref:PP2C family protein-serine/threonine phosphatase n=1 Tax=Streptomyces sp. TLI_146 TaxID=1938858 RepID=UPI00214B0677|nr:PP2C family protein-serine/threonine phosphatase [Streptomyces sp. TLI_146]
MVEDLTHRIALDVDNARLHRQMQHIAERLQRRLDLAHQSLFPHITATCLYALLDQGDDGSRTLTYSSAGHPPPLLITHEGDTRYLKGGRGLLLGVDPTLARHDAAEALPARSTALMYTDALIERRGEDLTHGLTRLRQHAAALAGEDLDTFCDELLTGMASVHADDIALLVARTPARPEPTR